MNTASRKAKGKRLQKIICKLILKYFPKLNEEDVLSRRMGRKGEDIILSDKAKNIFPYSIECKNQEKLKYIWDCYAQCENNSGNFEPLLILKMNTKKPLAIIAAEYFIHEESKKVRSLNLGDEVI